MDIQALFLQYWWVLVIILTLLLYKLIFRILGIIIIPENRIGLVTKKFVLVGKFKELPEGRIIAVNGEAGYQARTLAPGIYFWYWIWQYHITMQAFTIIPEGKVGLLVAKDGSELETGRILARKVDKPHSSLRDFTGSILFCLM